VIAYNWKTYIKMKSKKKKLNREAEKQAKLQGLSNNPSEKGIKNQNIKTQATTRKGTFNRKKITMPTKEAYSARRISDKDKEK
jgi:hypothetical protein